jgi:hypothetical protein
VTITEFKHDAIRQGMNKDGKRSTHKEDAEKETPKDIAGEKDCKKGKKEEVTWIAKASAVNISFGLFSPALISSGLCGGLVGMIQG